MKACEKNCWACEECGQTFGGHWPKCSQGWCHLYDREGKSFLFVPRCLINEVGSNPQNWGEEYTHGRWIKAYKIV